MCNASVLRIFCKYKVKLDLIIYPRKQIRKRVSKCLNIFLQTKLKIYRKPS